MMFGLFKTKHASIGCFGKLPIHADFIRLRAENDELGVFDKWIQQGMHFASTKLETGFKEQYRRSLYYNYIYQPKDSDNSLVGILYPGMDKSGRCFPFSIFILLNKYQIDHHLGVLLSYLQDVFFTNALNIASYGWVGLDASTFIQKYFDWQVFLNLEKKYKNDYNIFLRSKTIDSYFKDLHWDSNAEKRYLIFQNLLDTVKPLNKDNSHRFSLGIKFPLSSKRKQNRFEIIFWLDLIAKVFPLKKLFPTLFWNNKEDGGASNLFFYLNEPNHKHLLSLLNIDSDSDEGVCDLSEMRFSDIEAVKASMKEKHFMLLKEPETSLYDFLGSL